MLSWYLAGGFASFSFIFPFGVRSIGMEAGVVIMMEEALWGYCLLREESADSLGEM